MKTEREKRQRRKPEAFKHFWEREQKQGEVKQNTSNTDETELMCRDRGGGG